MISIVIPTRRLELFEKAAEFIRLRTKPEFEIIAVTDEYLGLNEKINKGILLSRGDHIALLHDDVEVTEGWADEVDKLDGVGAFRVEEKTVGITCWGGLGSGYCTDPTVHPDYSAFLVFKRDVLADIGLTDPFYKEPGWQDTDFGQQIRGRGYTIRCLQGTILHHAARTAPLSTENEAYYKKKWGL